MSAQTVTVTLDDGATGGRSCGACTLCCRLVPVASMQKAAGARCRHQSHSKGCGVYQHRPLECRAWSCRWLVRDQDMQGMQRPDRSHWVVDIMPDVVRMVDNETGEASESDVVQIWVDPAFPEARKDPAMRAYILRVAERHRISTILRHNSLAGTAVFAPPLTSDGQWHEREIVCSTGFGLWSRLPPALRPPI